MRRKIIAFGNYYSEFVLKLTEKELQKLKYILTLLETEDRMPVKFIKYLRDELYEVRMEYNSNAYRMFLFSTMDK